MIDSLQEQLLESSQEILRDCALPNGAIVAANSTRSDYPPTAENYFYSWMRDAAYQIYAAHAGGMSDAPDIKRRYLDWLVQSEAFAGQKDSSHVIKRYYPNGPADWRYGMEYQPDQTGALLWALHETTDDDDRQVNEVMRRLANGLAGSWSGTHFYEDTQDLWENQLAGGVGSESRNVFTYSLAASIEGLNSAIVRLNEPRHMLQRDEWIIARDGMLGMMTSKWGPYTKYMAGDPNNDIDASLSGLVFPFDNRGDKEAEIIDERRIETVQEIGRILLHSPEGVYRYPGDTYDGIARTGGGEMAAGAWPLLTFWHAIAVDKIGESQKAKEIYDSQVEHIGRLQKAGLIKQGHIPEQIFPDKERQGKGITPLAWSHAKFIIATLQLHS